MQSLKQDKPTDKLPGVKDLRGSTKGKSKGVAVLHIYIDTIPHAEQRYPTVGDYWHPTLVGGTKTTEIRISEMPSDDFEFLVAMHELVEMWLCKKRGITVEAIDKFDIAFEASRPEGNTDEPGDDLKAPYHKEHVFATWIERLIAHELSVNLDEYNNAVNAL